jgi:hypothetical protein
MQGCIFAWTGIFSEISIQTLSKDHEAQMYTYTHTYKHNKHASVRKQIFSSKIGRA